MADFFSPDPSNSQNRFAWLLVCLALYLGGCQHREESVPQQTPSVGTATSESLQPSQKASLEHAVQLLDATEDSGIDFVHFFDGNDQFFISETVASGVATLDYDGDGLIDIYFLNGSRLPADGGSEPTNRLFRNLGGFRFSDVTWNSESADPSHSLGVAVADYDNDGFPDIFINNFGANVLLRNNGDGSFENVAIAAGVACGNELGAGACFLDIDGDGNLDLYVGNYAQRTIEDNPIRTTEGIRSYPGPGDFKAEKDYLFLNLGDGRFQDISEESGIRTFSGTSMGVVASDVDQDGDMDIVVVCDVERNLLFLNDGRGRFVESGISFGLAFSGDGKMNGNMGVDAGDFDGDGKIDLVTTTYRADFPVLYKNDGQVGFQDVTKRSRLGQSVFPHVNWGIAFVDLDNSGWLDVFIANGDTDRLVSKWAFTTNWKLPNTLMKNLGNGSFSDISATSGSGLWPVESSRGMAVDDLDNDGFQDLVILNSLSRPTIVRNQSRSAAGNWLQIELRGTTSARDGTGALVKVTTDLKTQVSEVYSGRGYQSSYGNRLHFGLGSASRVESVQIRWGNGEQTILQDVSVNQRVLVLQ